MKITLTPAFVLHARPYRDTSLLVEFFTFQHGRISAVARSARGLTSRFKGSLQPFSPLLISWTGKTDLMQLTAAESHGTTLYLQGTPVFCGLYLNELLIKLLQRFDPYPDLFHCYETALRNLQDCSDPQKVLRIFEKQLLSYLGYGLRLDTESASGQNVHPDGWYRFDLERGLISCPNSANNLAFSGKHLLAIEKNNFENEDILRTARRLMRMVLSSLLGKNELKSRELFS